MSFDFSKLDLNALLALLASAIKPHLDALPAPTAVSPSTPVAAKPEESPLPGVASVEVLVLRARQDEGQLQDVNAMRSGEKIVMSGTKFVFDTQPRNALGQPTQKADLPPCPPNEVQWILFESGAEVGRFRGDQAENLKVGRWELIGIEEHLADSLGWSPKVKWCGTGQQGASIPISIKTIHWNIESEMVEFPRAD